MQHLKNRLSQTYFENHIYQGFQKPAVSIAYNPYQGLKLLYTIVKILYNPYQGLKQIRFHQGIEQSSVKILYNPYQGLNKNTY